MTSQKINNRSWAQWVGVGVSAFLVALLFRSCDQWGRTPPTPKTEPVVVNKVAKIANKPMALTGTYVNGLFVLNGSVPTEAVKAQMDAELKKTFGDGHYQNNLTISDELKPALWLGKLTDLFTFFKLPNAEVTFNGDTITLSGTASSLQSKIQEFVGGQTQVIALDVAATAQAATHSAHDALNALPATASGAEILHALNLQIINFASGSASIPLANQAVLSQAAQRLKAQKDFSFEISGHADNKGTAQSNLALSDKRAQAVREFLVKQGVPATNVTAKGYGDASPVADNSTETGRLKNRRIEYKAQ
ncbi:MAG: OmpA family protein [Formosimonas sp.]